MTKDYFSASADSALNHVIISRLTTSVIGLHTLSHADFLFCIIPTKVDYVCIITMNHSSYGSPSEFVLL